jgi:hypothetical protein
MYLLPCCEMNGNAPVWLEWMVLARSMIIMNMNVILLFDMGLWCIFCAWFDIYLLFFCYNVLQCLLSGGSNPLPLPLHVPFLCFIGVGKVLVDQLCCQARPRGLISCADCVKEGFFRGKPHHRVVVEHGLLVVG